MFTCDRPRGISRREALSGAAAIGLVAGPALAAGSTTLLRFEARRNGRQIGEQQTEIERQEAAILVRTTAEFAVKIGPITLYRYRHHALEHWASDRLAGLEAVTDQNGRMLHVTAEAGPQRMRITGPGGVREAPLTAAPFSHWNRSAARRPLFNPQDGKALGESVFGPTPAVIRLVGGATLEGQRLSFRGDAQIDDFYDASGLWAGLSGKLSDGSHLAYRRL